MWLKFKKAKTIYQMIKTLMEIKTLTAQMQLKCLLLKNLNRKKIKMIIKKTHLFKQN